jgi:hypothetical protein
MLGGIGGSDPVSYQDLIDFVVRKVGEYLVSDGDVAEKVRAYAEKVLDPEALGGGKVGVIEFLTTRMFREGKAKVSQRRALSEEELSTVTSVLIERIVTSLREGIHSEKAFVRGVASASRAAAQQSADRVANVTPWRLSRFVHSWMYSEPSEDIIATGDILDIREANGAECLYFVVTPLCDLGNFWKKTRSCLTVLRLEQLSANGKAAFKLHQNPKANFSSENISQVANGGTQGPIVFPSVRTNENETIDYLLFCHRIESFEVPKVKLPAQNGEQKPQDPPRKLTIPALEASLRTGGKEIKIVRVCRLAEPFLSPVLSHISNTVFQSAFPDLPPAEMERVNRSLA